MTTIAGPTEMPEIGFSTARGSNIAVTSTNMQKYAQVLDDIDQNIAKERENVSDFEKTSSECQSTLAKPIPLNQFEYRPPKTYTTSTPSKTESAVISPSKTSINKNESQISNALEEFKDWTRGAGALDDLFDDSFEQNQSVCGAIASDLQQTIDKSCAIGINVIHISDKVKTDRRKALNESKSDRTASRPKPEMGTLSLQKATHSLKLQELGTPKMYTRAQLLDFGVQSKVIDVDVENALE